MKKILILLVLTGCASENPAHTAYWNSLVQGFAEQYQREQKTNWEPAPQLVAPQNSQKTCVPILGGEAFQCF